MVNKSTRVFKLTKDHSYVANFDYFSYLSYRYTNLFFKSLIFRGRKLWAFEFFQDIKYNLKKKEGVDPF